jgi:hypothetical protein
MGIRLNSGAIPVAVNNHFLLQIAIRESLDLQATVSNREREGIQRLVISQKTCLLQFIQSFRDERHGM